MFGDNRIDSINEAEEEDSSFEKEKEEAEKSFSTNYSQCLADPPKREKLFKRRKRFLSNIDKLPLKRKFSPRKLQDDKDRKMSISDTEFQAFYNAFEQHSNNMSTGKITSESH